MGSAGYGNHLADLIRTQGLNSSGINNAKGSAGKGSSSFSPAVIAIVGILGAAFLVVSYYTMVVKYCRGAQRRPGSWLRPWRILNRNEEEGLQVTWPASTSVQEQGLEEALIQAIPVLGYTADISSPLISSADCAVCLSEFQNAERVRLLPSCGHAFHLPCIDAWLRSHASCPLCRTPLNFSSIPASLPRLNPSASPAPSLSLASAGSCVSSSALDNDHYRLLNSGNGDNMHVMSARPNSEPFGRKNFASLQADNGDNAQNFKSVEKEDFSFSRCFSTGSEWSRGFFNKSAMQFDDAQQHVQSSIIMSSKQGSLKMQRSSSYHAGLVFPPMKRLHPPAENQLTNVLSLNSKTAKGELVVASLGASSLHMSFNQCNIRAEEGGDGKESYCIGELQLKNLIHKQGKGPAFNDGSTSIQPLKSGAYHHSSFLLRQVSNGSSYDVQSSKQQIALMRIPNTLKRSFSGGRRLLWL